MKTIKYILPTLLLSVALWSSCGQEEDDEINALRSVAPLVIGSVSVERTEEAGTRAVPEDFTGTGYLYVGRRAANGYEAGGALYMPGPSGGWQPGPDQGLTLTANAASLYAYFPYGSYTDNKIPLTAQVYDPDKDVFCDFNGGENVCATYPSAAFVLKSQYALIKLQLTLDQKYNNATTDFTAVTASLTHIRLQSTPDGTFLQSATLDAGGNGEMGEENYTSTLIPVTKTLSNTAAIDIKLLVPEQYISDTKLDIVFTVDNALRKISIPANKFTPVAGVNNAYRLQRGYSYTIPVTLTNSYNAEGIPIIYNGAIYGYMAPGNLIAARNSNGTYSYRFAGEQGYCEEGVEFSYFSWNALTPDAAPNPGTTFDDTKDPCRLVSSEWRTPSIFDFSYLVSFYIEPKASVWIMDNGTTVNGTYYFSIEDAALFDSYSDADKKKYGQHLHYNDPVIFLPSAGVHSGGSYTGFNNELKYWTRTSDAADNAYHFDSSTTTAIEKVLKLPIRCIKWGYKN